MSHTWQNGSQMYRSTDVVIHLFRFMLRGAEGVVRFRDFIIHIVNNLITMILRNYWYDYSVDCGESWCFWGRRRWQRWKHVSWTQHTKNMLVFRSMLIILLYYKLNQRFIKPCQMWCLWLTYELVNYTMFYGHYDCLQCYLEFTFQYDNIYFIHL